jgi:hypothetical protein
MADTIPIVAGAGIVTFVSYKLIDMSLMESRTNRTVSICSHITIPHCKNSKRQRLRAGNRLGGRLVKNTVLQVLTTRPHKSSLRAERLSSKRKSQRPIGQMHIEKRISLISLDHLKLIKSKIYAINDSASLYFQLLEFFTFVL